jgi:hypothetical protein
MFCENHACFTFVRIRPFLAEPYTNGCILYILYAISANLFLLTPHFARIMLVSPKHISLESRLFVVEPHQHPGHGDHEQGGDQFAPCQPEHSKVFEKIIR